MSFHPAHGIGDFILWGVSVEKSLDIVDHGFALQTILSEGTFEMLCIVPLLSLEAHMK